MGYTHYLKTAHPNQGLIPMDRWEKIKIATICAIVESRVPISDLILNDSNIVFNGVGDGAHETFVVSRKVQDFDFCKTARKPYDQIVCMVLAYMLLVIPELVDITSDGVMTGPEAERNWNSAHVWAELYRASLED